MGKFSIILNTAGMAVSFFCFLHCVLVILIFAGILSSSLLIIEIFEDPYNHAWLVVTGLSLAALSLIKLNLGNLEVKTPANINITNTQCKKQKKDTAIPAVFKIIENLPIVTL